MAPKTKDNEITVEAELTIAHGAKLPTAEEYAKAEAEGYRLAVPLLLYSETVRGFDKAWARSKELYPTHFGPVTVRFNGFVRKEN
jgi:hypothetical protein